MVLHLLCWPTWCSLSHNAHLPACSPRLHSSLRSYPAAHKTSEQLELERVEREKAEAAALRRKNAAAVKAVLAPPAPPVAHSSKPLTEPVGMELSTTMRHRVHGMETRSMVGAFRAAQGWLPRLDMLHWCLWWVVNCVTGKLQEKVSFAKWSTAECNCDSSVPTVPTPALHPHAGQSIQVSGRADCCV